MIRIKHKMADTLSLSCVSDVVRTNPDFKIDAFELLVLWLIHEKHRGCRTKLRNLSVIA